MATKQEARDRAAEILGRLKPGQSLASQDATRITSAYTEVYAQLKKDGLAIWTESGTIPDDILPHLAAIMAENAMNTYGISEERRPRVETAAAVGRREIQKFATPDYESQDEPDDF